MTREEFESNLSQLHKGGAIRHEKPTEEEYKLIEYVYAFHPSISETGMPALSVMLDVAHAAMKDWQHGITKNEVQSLFSKYVEEGGSQLSFYMTVYMEIFTVSGFFSVNLSNQMSGALQEAKEEAL